jgi:ubiquinone/menaquinone biosynthesis C-methylase UbiE
MASHFANLWHPGKLMSAANPTLKAADPAPPWDRAAKGWNQHTEMIRTWLQQATNEMLDAAQISTGMAVLDVAAGAGDQTLSIAARVGSNGRVLATDLSPMILALAKQNAARQGFQQVDTRVLDAQHLDLQGANFDAVVSRLGLMFCQSPLAALEQAREALRPGGRFAALVFSQPKTNPCLVITLTCARRHAGLSPRAELSDEQAYHPGGLMSLGKPGLLEGLLSSAGFSNITVRALSAPMHLASVDAYIDFLRSAASPIIEMLAKLSPAAQQSAWSDMTEQLKQFEHQGGWTGPNELLLCEARKPSESSR